jgi:voltage-gated potassium channel
MGAIRENRRLGLNGTKFQNHVVIIGWSEFGKSVTDQLVGAGRHVAIITKEQNNIDIIREQYKSKAVFVLYSDYNNFEHLEKVNIEKSSIVFVNFNDDTEKLVYILNLKKHHPELEFIVTLTNANLKSTFQSAGVTYAISNSEIASKLLASYIFEPDVAVYTEEIIAYARTDEMYDMKEFKVLENNPYVNKPYGDAFYDLKRECNVILVGLVKEIEGRRKLLKNPEDNEVIEAGDYLIMIMNRQAVKKLTDLFKTHEGHINM